MQEWFFRLCKSQDWISLGVLFNIYHYILSESRKKFMVQYEGAVYVIFLMNTMDYKSIDETIVPIKNMILNSIIKIKFVKL